MTDEEYDSCKARVEGFLAKWRPICHLDRHSEFVVAYFREAADFRRATSSEDDSTIMTVAHQWQYEMVKLRVNCPEVHTRADADLELDVVHELGHVLLGPLPKRKDKHGGAAKLEEFVTTRLMKALLGAYAAGHASGAS